MEWRDACYFCTSTFQLFSILSLAVFRAEKADLYIDPQFKDAEEIVSRITSLSIFNKVSLIDSDKIYNKYYTSRNGFLNHLQIATTYLHVDDIAKIILGENVCYRRIFVSTRAYLPRMVFLNYLKKHVECEICYFDDGVGSYFGDQAYEPRGADKLVRLLLFGRVANDVDHVRYLFAPEVFKAVNTEGKQRICKINPIWTSDRGRTTLNQVFKADSDCGISEPVIILEEPFHDLFTETGEKTINQIINELREATGFENTIIKKHPRSNIPEEKGVKYYKRFDIPLEAICINSDMNNKTLVSCFSTAAVTPKILMGQEPYVLLLYKIIKTKNGISAEMERFFQRVRSSYSRPERFIIPETMDEVYGAIALIRTQVQRRRDVE